MPFSYSHKSTEQKEEEKKGNIPEGKIPFLTYWFYDL